MDLKFNNGYIYKDNIQVYILPKYYYIAILKILYDKYEYNALFDLLKDYFKYESYLFYKKMPKNIYYNKIYSLNFFLKHLNSLGMGSIKLIYFGKEKIIIKHFNSRNNNEILESLILNSYFNSFLDILFGYSYKFKKNKKNLILYKTTKKYDFTYYNNSSFKNNKKIRINSLIKKFFINSFISNKGGENKIWNIPVIIIPSIFFVLLLSNVHLTKSNIVYIARSQARCAVEFQKNVFGLFNKLFLFKEIIKQSEIMGFGLVNFDFKSNEFEIRNNVSNLKEITSTSNYNMETYLSNLIFGSYQQIFSKQIRLVKLSNKKFKIIKIQKKINESEIPYQKIQEVLNI